MSAEPRNSADPGEFALALRAAVHERGLSLDRLRYHLSKRGHELSVATLSYWQSGRSRPERASSLQALGDLEEILGVESGSLLAKLQPRRRRDGDQGPLGSVTELTPDGDVLDELCRELGMSWDHGLERISVHDRMELRADRTEERHVVREVLRATRDGVSRYPIWYHNDDPNVAPTLTAVTNCSVGDVVASPERLLTVSEIILARPLMTGESLLVEHRLDSAGNTEPVTWWARGVYHKIREMHLEVRFHPDMIPVSAQRYFFQDGTEKVEPIIIGSATIHLLTLDFGPGNCGLRWTW